MLTHLLFSISALFLTLIFVITYFSYKKRTDSIRSKIYVYMICFTIALTIIEIIEGVTYVYNISIIFSLMWKLHSIVIVLFIAALFYYLLVTVENQTQNVEDLFWNSRKFFAINNIFTITFILIIILSIIYVKSYPMGLTMFYFYTSQSINFLLVLYFIYILYNIYIVYLKNKIYNFDTNDYIILIGTFILFIVALIFEYEYPEISIYSTLFTLILILIYYFKENEDLLIIEELKKEKNDLITINNLKLNYLDELIKDIGCLLSSFKIINNKLENCNNLTDEEINENLNNLNCISNTIIAIRNNLTTNKITNYRIDELINNIEIIIKLNIKQKPIKYICNIDKNIPSLLAGDYLIIYRIIVNLVTNAIENTEIGRVVLTITGERQKDNEILNIKVSDTGTGIKKEDYGKIFEDNLNNYNYNYLALIKKNVNSLNGKIYFDSHYGAGTIFYVSIPQRIINETPLSEVPIVAESARLKDYNNKKVLIIDSEDYSSKKLTNILRKYKFSVKHIENGKDAINAIKCDEEYDLIIVTDNIKDFDFIKISNLLLKLKKYVKVPPLIALVVNNDKYYLNGVYDEYLLKPLNIKKFEETIEKIC